MVLAAVTSVLVGMRRGEVLGINAKRIDWASRKVTIIDRKNGKDLVVNLNAVAFATLKALCANRIAGPVFTIKVRSLNHAFARARKRAGIEDFRIHDLRHTFASQTLIQKQGDLSTVQRLLGHSSIRSTERYAHLSDEHLQRAVEGLKMGVA